MKSGKALKGTGNKNILNLGQRILLLIILGYESIGCLLGGILLILSPDGRYMDMPVKILHGYFSDFLIPGIILFILGILNSLAFISVRYRFYFDWLITLIALSGLIIWFAVEISILQELHWLHGMWGLPVLIGIAVFIPLLMSSLNANFIARILLNCGILAAFWYVTITILVPTFYKGYQTPAFTISELSALEAPTRIMWVLLILLYPLLLISFGWGVLYVAYKNRALLIAGKLLIIYGIINLYWPPMHQRQVIAAGDGTLTDSLHIVWAVITLLLSLALMGFAAAGLGKHFRLYTVMTWVIFIIFGVLTFIDSSGIQTNQPTPYIGIWERINIGAFLLWLIIFSYALKGKFSSINSSSTS
ncbi:MAG: DUF998 domain-containing protein [Flavobacterium sp. JAD_PAG50586_2]|nr:MAG: DUF998 domain-containing protein [Flavobacterium sp. JAD_PAG50586_2]